MIYTFVEYRVGIFLLLSLGMFRAVTHSYCVHQFTMTNKICLVTFIVLSVSCTNLLNSPSLLPHSADKVFSQIAGKRHADADGDESNKRSKNEEKVYDLNLIIFCGLGIP